MPVVKPDQPVILPAIEHLIDALARSPSDDVAIIAYKAHAIRDSGEPYEAICTSSYVCVDGYWWLTHHQQTPVS